jgi:hypothetical protein
LAALDDNGDGWLQGAETKGLAVWRDGDSDGVADAGEVRPLRAAGIKAIATRATSHAGNVLQNARGCLFSDGTARPTFDWVVNPVVASGNHNP